MGVAAAMTVTPTVFVDPPLLRTVMLVDPMPTAVTVKVVLVAVELLVATVATAVFPETALNGGVPPLATKLPLCPTVKVSVVGATATAASCGLRRDELLCVVAGEGVFIEGRSGVLPGVATELLPEARRTIARNAITRSVVDTTNLRTAQNAKRPAV